MQRNHFGIDFGTTNTAVVQYRVDEKGTKLEYCSEDMMPFPSLLAISKKDSSVLFGRQVKARRQQLSRDYHIFASFKSQLGQDEVYKVNGKEYTPTDITALYLKSIKDYIKSNMELELDEATFAIPVDFTPLQRKELRKAATSVGIKINKFVSESTAAYMRSIDLVKGLSKVAVFDWGGGTLDISVLSVEKNRLMELAVHGKKLGGDDIDKILARKIHADIASKISVGVYDDISDADKDMIIAESERAKIVLSDDDFYRVLLNDYVLPGSVRIPLELERFKEIIRPQIDDAVATLYEAIKKANISVAQLDGIIMVGGSCEIQPLQEIMEELFEKKNIKLIFPEDMQWSVAVGAAKIEISDTNYKLNQSLGVILSDETFYPVIEKDSPVPFKTDEIRFGVVEETNDAHFIDRKSVV
jgi:molecular chaperone DnaK